MIKQAYLKEEYRQIETFLANFGLRFDNDVTTSFYMEELGQIIGCVCIAKDIIKDLAVHEDYQGEQRALQLVEQAIKKIHANGYESVRVFTTTSNVKIFESMSFTLLASSNQVAILERGQNDIQATIIGIKQTIENITGSSVSTLDLGTIVVNCNPVTLGHYQLIEYATKRHDYVVVFVVDEDLSYFSFKERFALLHLAMMSLPNVILVPSSKYIVSSLTFPSYFLKTVEERDKAYAMMDALLFKDYFMPLLHLHTRYIGTETDPVMVLYNLTLQEVLQDNIKLVPRFLMNDVVISASLVRSYIKEGRIEEALLLVPQATRGLLRMIAYEKTKS
jgi:[citrate (pro-3S)-lyase] ligase